MRPRGYKMVIKRNICPRDAFWAWQRTACARKCVITHASLPHAISKGVKEIGPVQKSGWIPIRTLNIRNVRFHLHNAGTTCTMQSSKLGEAYMCGFPHLYTHTHILLFIYTPDFTQNKGKDDLSSSTNKLSLGASHLPFRFSLSSCQNEGVWVGISVGSLSVLNVL